MKKTVSVLLVMLMIISCVSSVFAYDSEEVPVRPYTDNILTVYASDAVLDGETLKATVTVNVKNNPGIWGLDMVVVYPDCLTIGSSANIMFGDAPTPKEYASTGVVDKNTVGNVIMKYVMNEIGTQTFENTYGVIGDGLLWHSISRSGIENGSSYPDCDYTGIVEAITFTYDVTKNTEYGDTVPVYLFAFSKSAFHSEPIHEDVAEEWLRENNGYVTVECFNGSVDVSAVCRHESYRYDNFVFPTCTVDGGYNVYCKDCNAFIKKVVEKAKGHTFSEKWTVDVEPTITTDGSKSRHCTKCNAKTDVTVITKLCKHEVTERFNEIPSTCTTKGVYDTRCSICGDVLEVGTEIPTVPHELSDEWIILVLPTTTNEGAKARMCVNCRGYFDYVVIPQICAHENTEHINVIDSTCTTEGSYDIKCLDCNEIIATEVVMEMKPHTYSEEWTIDVEATATTPGEKSHHCLYCEARTDITEIPIVTYKVGDIDGNGRVNSRDVTMFKLYNAGKPATVIKSQLDVDGSGRVNARDVMALRKLLAGMV